MRATKTTATKIQMLQKSLKSSPLSSNSSEFGTSVPRRARHSHKLLCSVKVCRDFPHGDGSLFHRGAACALTAISPSSDVSFDRSEIGAWQVVSMQTSA